ncbi:MAG: hypothetical protein F4133_09610, partial [Gammaproteobacteria bacterium]|nr:hypothetical protein [Gammaproteobacteria bacterium]
TEDGTAVAGKDYTAANGRLTIPKGEQAATVEVTTLQDTVDEPDQTFGVVVAKTSGTAESMRLRATGVIRDDDARPKIGIGDVSVSEGDTAGFRASLSAVSEKEVTTRWATVDGTARKGTDYVAGRGVLTFAPGDLHADIAVDTIEDAAGEAPETFEVALFHADEGRRRMADATATILDDDALTFSVSDARATEGGAAATFTVRLSGTAATPVSVDWKTQDGMGDHPAKTGGPVSGGLDDYAAVPATTLTFAAGETEKTVSVQVKNDSVAEREETFRVVLENPVGASVADGAGIGTIEDDDHIRFWIANESAEIPEGDSMLVRVKRSSGTGSFRMRACLEAGTATPSNASTGSALDDDVRVTRRHASANDCAIHTDDTSGRIFTNFAEGETEKTFRVFTIPDDRVEGDETFTIRSTSQTAPDASLLKVIPGSIWYSREFTILDDDAIRLRVERRPGRLWEGEKAVYDLHVDPPLSAGETATVRLATSDGTATAGEDYDAHADTVVTLKPPASAGKPAATVEIVTREDDAFEPDETFTVTLHTPSAGLALSKQAGSIEETILDDDRATVLVDDAVADEGGQARVRVRLTGKLDRAATVTWETVDGDAVSPADFTAVSGGTATIKAGEVEAVLAVSTVQDAKDEDDEDFRVRITKFSEADFRIGSPATVTIRDDDDPALAFGYTFNTNRELENIPWSSGAANLTGMPFGHVTWTVEGNDAAAFRIDADTGNLTLPAQNFEKPADHDKDNTYEVTVRATDEDGTTGTKDITVIVRDYFYGTFRGLWDKRVTEGGTVTFDPDFYSRDEGGIYIESPPLQWRTVLKTSGSGVAAADGDDFTQVPSGGPVIHRIYEDPLRITFQTVQDDLAEPDEVFGVEFFSNSDDVAFSAKSVVVTIEDDDARGVTVSGGPLSLDEADDTQTAGDSENEASYTVVLDSEPTDDVTVSVASADTAIATVSAASLTFTPDDWDEPQTVTVTAVPDDVHSTGGSRAVAVTHTIAAGSSDYNGVSVADVAVTVTDDDAAPSGVALGVDADTGVDGVQDSVAEDGGARTARVTATLKGGAAIDVATEVTVSVGAEGDTAVSVTDYAAVDDFTITIPAGDASAHADFALSPVNDTLDEDRETLTVGGSAGTLTVTGAAIAITDDDAQPTLSVDAPSVDEGDAGATPVLRFTVTLDAASGKAVTVGYAGLAGGTATSGEDFEAFAAGTLAFAAGETSRNIDVTVNGDAVDEDSETLKVRLSAPVNARFAGDVTSLDATGTITDDDAKGVTVAGGPLRLAEADDP